MKCHHCEKPAVFHITELTGAEPQELHLCEDHARQYLAATPDEVDEPEPAESAATSKQKLGETAEELSKLDQRACPKCGITFYEFRQQGRLGCPYDYVFFEQELEPLLFNIHGEKQHVGKRPSTGASTTGRHADLIRLRREMQEAVEREDYEQASRIRDEIRRIEGGAEGGATGEVPGGEQGGSNSPTP